MTEKSIMEDFFEMLRKLNPDTLEIVREILKILSDKA